MKYVQVSEPNTGGGAGGGYRYYMQERGGAGMPDSRGGNSGMSGTTRDVMGRCGIFGELERVIGMGMTRQG